MGEAKAKEALRAEAQHAHYDLPAVEQQMRSHLAEQETAARAMLSGDADALAFMEASGYFNESRIQFTLGGMRSVNEGVGRDDMLVAAGRSLGIMLANLMEVCIGQRERAQVQNALNQAFAEVAAAQKAADGVRIDPMPAGRA